jgi:hypothetical protein
MAFDQGRNMLWTWESACNKNKHNICCERRLVQWFNLKHYLIVTSDPTDIWPSLAKSEADDCELSCQQYYNVLSGALKMEEAVYDLLYWLSLNLSATDLEETRGNLSHKETLFNILYSGLIYTQKFNCQCQYLDIGFMLTYVPSLVESLCIRCL